MKAYHITIERSYFDIEVKAPSELEAKRIAKRKIIQLDLTPDFEYVAVDLVEEDEEQD